MSGAVTSLLRMPLWHTQGELYLSYMNRKEMLLIKLLCSNFQELIKILDSYFMFCDIFT
jgi:hypothetical protein